MTTTQEPEGRQSAAAIWRKAYSPVIYHQGRGQPLMVKLPYAGDNYEWLKGDRVRYPQWQPQYKCWLTPASWFNKLIPACLQRWGRVYVIQAYREFEKCAPACWDALGFDCECSCMGKNHGSGISGKWWVISETCAVQWKERQLACRLITSIDYRNRTPGV